MSRVMLRVLRDPRQPWIMTILPRHRTSAREINTPLTWHCVMCGVNTHPGAKGRIALCEDLDTKGKSRARFDYRTEVYRVHDTVWKRAKMSPHDGCLCIGCLEKRLGRKLKAKDFDLSHPLNETPGSKRLLQRRGDWALWNGSRG
jgi:hypothetical protein